MIPQNRSIKPSKRILMQAALPSSAQMLSSLREILINQIELYKKKALCEEFTSKDIQSINSLIKSVHDLDANTSRVGEDVAAMIESMSPEELEAAERQAYLLLGTSTGTPTAR